MTLKEEILNNEKILLENFSNEYNLAIKYFMAKIEALPTDGDIVKFLNNPNIRSIKKKQYALYHSRGFKTAIDIMEEYNKENLSYTNIDGLEEGSLINALTICAIGNNFNHQKGMYYNEKEDILLLKTQLKSGQYGDKWIVRNKKLCYFLQIEKESMAYVTKIFSHRPNRICSEIIDGKNKHTKVYLFYRYNSGDRYFYDGEYIPKEFVENNKAMMLRKKLSNKTVS